MITLPRNALVGYFGTRRAGKTTRLKYNLRRRGGSWIIYDVKQEYGAYGVIVRSVEDFLEALRRGCKRIVFQPRTVDLEEFNRLCKLIFELVKNSLFVIDELQLVANKHRIPEWLKQLVTVKGADDLGVWGCTQLPQNAHNDFLDQLEAIYAQTLGGKAAQHIADAMQGEVSADDLEALPRYNTILWTDHAPLGSRIFRLDPVPAG